MQNFLQLANYKIKTNKTLFFSLKNIYGLNFQNSKKLVQSIGCNLNSLTSSLTNLQLKKLTYLLVKNYLIQDELKHKVAENLKFLILNKTYRGFRHKLHLPSRGQRTYTNRKTKRHAKLY